MTDRIEFLRSHFVPGSNGREIHARCELLCLFNTLQCFRQDGTGTCQMAMPPLIFWRGRRLKPDSRVNGFLSRAAGLRAVQGNHSLMSPHHRGTDAVVRWAGAREQDELGSS